jgi:hypothetical protein
VVSKFDSCDFFTSIWCDFRSNFGDFFVIFLCLNREPCRYCDHTASGRPSKLIEDPIRDYVLPVYVC